MKKRNRHQLNSNISRGELVATQFVLLSEPHLQCQLVSQCI